MSWSPEEGDEAWSPEDGVEYSDSEIRFGPLYRRVKAIFDRRPIEIRPSDEDLIAECRRVIRATLALDDETQNPNALALEVMAHSRARRSNPMKMLFVCNQGRNRSRQAQELVEAVASKKGWQIETRSVGIHSEDRPLTEGLMDWGEVIFLFQDDHLPVLQERYPRQMFRMRCVLIQIPDVYDFGSPVLKKKLRSKLRGWWEFLEEIVS